jgi:hypothetical protein
MAEIKSATILEDEPGFMMSPDMPGVPAFKVRMNTCSPRNFWRFGGRVPVVGVKAEFKDEVAKRYFMVPFFFFNPRTGNLTEMEPSLAQVAHLITVKRNGQIWAEVIGYEDA